MAFFKDQEPSASARGTAEKHRLGARLPLHKPLHVKKGKQFSRGHSYKTGNSLFSKRECIFTLIYNREFKCRKNKLYSRTRHSARMPLPPGRVRHQNQQNPKNLKVSEIPRPGLRHRRGASASPVRTLPTRGSFHRSNSLLRQPASARLLPTLGAGGRRGTAGGSFPDAGATVLSGPQRPLRGGLPLPHLQAPPEPKDRPRRPASGRGRASPAKDLGAAGGIGTPGWPGCREGSLWTAAALRQHCPAVRCAPHPTPAGRKEAPDPASRAAGYARRADDTQLPARGRLPSPWVPRLAAGAGTSLCAPDPGRPHPRPRQRPPRSTGRHRRVPGTIPTRPPASFPRPHIYVPLARGDG